MAGGGFRAGSCPSGMLLNGRIARSEYRKRTGIWRGQETALSVLMGCSDCPSRDPRNLVGGTPRPAKFCEAVFQPDDTTNPFGKLLRVPRPRSRRAEGRAAPGPWGIRL